MEGWRPPRPGGLAAGLQAAGPAGFGPGSREGWKPGGLISVLSHLSLLQGLLSSAYDWAAPGARGSGGLGAWGTLRGLRALEGTESP